MTQPTVSVVMPAFNAERYVAEAVASLQSQAGVDLEIVVVDDGSADATARIVRGLAAEDPRIRLLSGAHRGVAAARNRGLAACRGAVIAFLDADDLCPPDRLLRQVTKLRAYPEVAVVIGDLFLFERLEADFRPAPGSRTAQILGISLTTACFRRRLFDEIGGFDETLEYCEDFDFYLRLLEADTRLLIEAEIATFYRRHASNMTNDQTRLTRSHLHMLHRSLQRRRQRGEARDLELFFFKSFPAETVIMGLKRKPVPAEA